MQIEHLAIWTMQLDELRSFYKTYFQAQAGDKYVNPDKQFESYFLSFPQGGARLELMRKPDVVEPPDPTAQLAGYAHLAFSVGSEEQVDALTAQLKADGFQVIDGPRHTGDGYYESCVLDPDGNRVEITV
jgi:lactoylglutathione lyase